MKIEVTTDDGLLAGARQTEGGGADQGAFDDTQAGNGADQGTRADDGARASADDGADAATGNREGGDDQGTCQAKHMNLLSPYRPVLGVSNNSARSLNGAIKVMVNPARLNRFRRVEPIFRPA